MTLPEIANRLRRLAKAHGLPELATLAAEIARPRVAPRGKIASLPLTPQRVERIRRLRFDHPALSQAAIARQVGVNPGRVSEVLHGKRT